MRYICRDNTIGKIYRPHLKPTIKLLPFTKWPFHKRYINWLLKAIKLVCVRLCAAYQSTLYFNLFPRAYFQRMQ